jgi:hypothetical protein
MKIFLSWSGEISKNIATDLKDFLRTTIQALDPFFSRNDIAKGTRWSGELAKQLNDINIGIIVLTKENTKAPWILFEAGALAKNIEGGLVCTILTDVKESDLNGPLLEFQNTKFNKEDFRKLIHDLNERIEKPIEKEILNQSFNKQWSSFERKVKKHLKVEKELLNKPILEEREVLDEVLRIVRKFEYKHIYDDSDIFQSISGKIVRFNETKKQIEFLSIEERRIQYEIPLDRLNNTAEILDFLIQVFNKKIFTEKHIYQFLECLEELSDIYFHRDPQAIFCPFGAYMEIDWNKKTASMRGLAPIKNLQNVK